MRPLTHSWSQQQALHSISWFAPKFTCLTCGLLVRKDGKHFFFFFCEQHIFLWFHTHLQNTSSELLICEVCFASWETGSTSFSTNTVIIVEGQLLYYIGKHVLTEISWGKQYMYFAVIKTLLVFDFWILGDLLRLNP